MGNNRDMPSGSRDDRILSLLDRLGKRLIETEQERQTIKDTIESLEDKLDGQDSFREKTEKGFISLQNQIHKAASNDEAMSKRQTELEDKLQAQIERIEKAAALADRLEEAMALHKRTMRRLDKMHQDRARLIRKMETIEEKVHETQESINAKALVLLTDQSPVAKTAASNPANEDNPSAKRQRQTMTMLAATVCVFSLVTLAGGWGIYQYYSSPRSIQTAELSPDTVSYIETTPAETTAVEQLEIENTEIATAQQETTSSGADAAQPDAQTVPASEPPVAAQETVTPAEKPTNMSDMDETLVAALDKAPSDLSESLNAIKPASGPVPEDLTAPVAYEKKAKTAKAPVQKAVAKEETKAAPQNVAFKETAAKNIDDVAQFLKSQQAKGSIRQRLQPDPALPAAIQQIEAKAFEGIPEAQHDLAAIYTAGHGGVAVDFSKASQWFLEASLGGVANARYNLGVLYHQGLGVQKDIHKTLGWYRAAAQQAHPEALYNLGIAHLEGIGTDYNPQKAAAYFEKAARKGVMEAAYNLGLIYENGLMGNVNSDKALQWYKHAANLGSDIAMTAMEELAESLDVNPQDVTPAISSATAAPATAPEKSSTADQMPNTQRESNRGNDLKSDGLAKANLNDQDAGFTQKKEIISKIQEHLISQGLYPGPADGVSSLLFEDAVRSYQTTHNLQPTGRATESLLLHIETMALGPRKFIQ